MSDALDREAARATIAGPERVGASSLAFALGRAFSADLRNRAGRELAETQRAQAARQDTAKAELDRDALRALARSLEETRGRIEALAHRGQ